MYPGSVARVVPDRPAIVLADTGETRTYAELDDRSARLATLLRAHGLRNGDAVLILLANDVRWAEVGWACWRSGLVLVAVDRHLTARELAPLLADAAPRAVVASADLLERLDAAGLGADVVRLSTADGAGGYERALAACPRDPDLPESAGGRLLFSSGTTGRPKPFRVPPVDRHPDAMPVRSAGLMRALGFAEGLPEAADVLLVPGPAYHAGPLGFLQSTHQLGGTVVLMGRFDAEAALAAIERYGVTHSNWVPTMFVRLLRLPAEVRDRYDLSTHRAALHGAAPCPPEVKRALMRWWGPIVHEYYGASEGYGRTTIGPEEWLAHPGSVGRAVGSRVLVADPQGRPLPSGDVGAVWFARPDAPEPARDVDGRADLGAAPGWGTAGDLGHLDADGYLYLAGRAGHTIITGGVNVYPREVEDVLITHPAVDDVAVLGVADAEYGERVAAVVVARPGVETDGLGDDLVAWARTRLAPVKVPRTVRLVGALPRSDSGKVRLPELRAGLASDAAV